MKEKIGLSIIIPCYNSGQTIERVVCDAEDCIKGIYNYQFILVNDHSSDHVWDVIQNMCEKNPRVTGISLSRNFGQQAARMAALPYIEGEYVLFMDDDGQHPAEGISRMIQKAEEGYDIVFALFKQKKERAWKKLGSWVNTKMTDYLMQKPKEIKQSSFFIVKRFVAEELKHYHSPFPYIFGYLMQVTKRIANVELQHQERLSGSSGYNLKKLIWLWMNGFVSFSVIPLRISSALGTICACSGFLWGLVLIIQKICNPSVAAGYTSLIAVILFCSGILMLMLGLTGEYIGRIFITLNNVPQYVVSEVKNAKDPKWHAWPERQKEGAVCRK